MGENICLLAYSDDQSTSDVATVGQQINSIQTNMGEYETLLLTVTLTYEKKSFRDNSMMAFPLLQ